MEEEEETEEDDDEEEEEEEEEDNEMEEDDEEEVSHTLFQARPTRSTWMRPSTGRNRSLCHSPWPSYPRRSCRLHLAGGFGQGGSDRQRGRRGRG